MDYTIEGKCPEGCGKCCTSILPVNDHEIKKIKQYIQRKEIQAVNYNEGQFNYVDKCPFLNEQGRCNVYVHRPEVCRHFKCGGNDEPFFHWDKTIRNFYEVFFPEIVLPLDKPDSRVFDLAYQKKKQEVINKKKRK